MDSLQTHRQRVAEWARRHYPADQIPNFTPPSWYGGITPEGYRDLPFCTIESRVRARLLLMIRPMLMKFGEKKEHVDALTFRIAQILIAAEEAELNRWPVRAPAEATDLYCEEIPAAISNLREVVEHRRPHAIVRRISFLWNTAHFLGHESAPVEEACARWAKPHERPSPSLVIDNTTPAT